MRLIRHILLLLTLAAGAAAFPGGAMANDIYTVRNVPVDVSAGSALEARNVAQLKGQRAALDTLLRRMTPSTDWAQLPQPDDITVQRAVRGFQVASEKTSATRYIAKLHVSFHPDAIRRLLRNRGLAYAETQAKPAVLLAVYDSADQGRLLWEDANIWRKAFATVDLTNNLAPVKVPLGDAQDIEISAGQALSGDVPSLMSLARRYDAESVVVAYATQSGNTVSVKITQVGTGTTNEPLTASGSGADVKSALEAAAADTIAMLDAQWKQAVIVRGGAAGQIFVNASFATMAEWEQLRARLGASPLVQDMQVRGIAANGADIRVSYRGSPDQLALVLAQQDVELTRIGGGWWLRMPQAPAQPVPMLQP